MTRLQVLAAIAGIAVGAVLIHYLPEPPLTHYEIVLHQAARDVIYNVERRDPLIVTRGAAQIRIVLPPEEENAQMDLVVPISGGAITACIVGVIAWFAKEKIARWDKHLLECGEKSIKTAQLEGHVNAIGEKVDQLADTVKQDHEDNRTSMTELKDIIGARGDRIDRMDDKLDQITMALLR